MKYAGINDLSYLADYAGFRTLRNYPVEKWVLVQESGEITLGLVAGLISLAEGEVYTKEETARRRSLFQELLEHGTVQVFSSLDDLSDATGLQDFLVIYLGDVYVLQSWEP